MGFYLLPIDYNRFLCQSLILTNNQVAHPVWMRYAFLKISNDYCLISV